MFGEGKDGVDFDLHWEELLIDKNIRDFGAGSFRHYTTLCGFSCYA